MMALEALGALKALVVMESTSAAGSRETGNLRPAPVVLLMEAARLTLVRVPRP
jgi:hypothetical protein